VLHLKNNGTKDVDITIEIDFLGNESWEEYKTITVKKGEYTYHIFPDGFSAQWVRLKANGNTVLTAQFVYN
jgi:hypothetical protein